MVFGKEKKEFDEPEVEYLDKGLTNFSEIAHVGMLVVENIFA
jgi:hypothetical protein